MQNPEIGFEGNTSSGAGAGHPGHSHVPVCMFYLIQSHFSKFHKGIYNVFCSPLNSHRMAGLEAGPQDAIRL